MSTQLYKISLTIILVLGLTSCFTPSETVNKEQSNKIESDLSGVLYSLESVDSHSINYHTPKELSVPILHPDYISEVHSPLTIHSDVASSYWLSFNSQAKQKIEKVNRTSKEVKIDYKAPHLWGELVTNFKFYDDLKDKLTVKKYIKYILKNPRLFNRVTAGASPYLYYVYNEIKKRNMPMELALLPIIESRYYPFAVSHRKAAGLWQFTPSTGKYYGLKQDWWYDGRFDVIQSTNSALNMLQDLHDRFNSWPLALAAYNYGLGNVTKAIKKAKKQGKKGDFWSLKLPKETSNYVPKLLAYCYIMANFKKYDLVIKQIKNKAVLAKVTINQPIELEIMAKASKVSLRTFRKLNPGFRRWATKPKSQYQVLVPYSNKEFFTKSIAKLSKDYRVQWRYHQVISGDTLYDLARFYGTSVQALKKTNRIRKHIIKPGDRLIIPTRAT